MHVLVDRDLGNFLDAVGGRRKLCPTSWSYRIHNRTSDTDRRPSRRRSCTRFGEQDRKRLRGWELKWISRLQLECQCVYSLASNEPICGVLSACYFANISSGKLSHFYMTLAAYAHSRKHPVSLLFKALWRDLPCCPVASGSLLLFSTKGNK